MGIIGYRDVDAVELHIIHKSTQNAQKFTILRIKIAKFSGEKAQPLP